MKVLLDQGLPRSAVELLRDRGIDAVHTGDCGLATATDSRILERARRDHRVIVTLDADFHALIALSGAKSPSVVRIRVEGLRAKELVELVQRVLGQCAKELGQGALVSVTPGRVRLEHLPIGRSATGAPDV